MENNPNSKSIDIKTQEGMDKLKLKARYYGHYAEQLKVLDLIEEIELLRKKIESLEFDGQSVLYEMSKKQGW